MVGLCRPVARILSGGIAEIEPADGLDVAAEIQTAGVLAGAALGVSVEMDYDVDGLRFGAQVVPYDDEVRPALSAVCGEERYAVHFQMSAFPGALAGGLAGGVLRDFALRIGGSGSAAGGSAFGREQRRRGAASAGAAREVRLQEALGRCIGKAVVSKGCCLRSGLRRRREARGAKCLNGSTIEATVRGQPDRLLKEAYCAASGRPEYTGHRDAETKRRQLRLNHADHVRIGSTAGGGRHHGRLHERPQARPDPGPRGLSKGRSLAWRLTPERRRPADGGECRRLGAALERRASRGRGTTAELRARSGRRARWKRRANSSESSVFKIELECFWFKWRIVHFLLLSGAGQWSAMPERPVQCPSAYALRSTQN